MDMAFFYGLNSNTSSNFFNSMLGTRSSSSMFGSLTASLGDYAAIQNGSYRMLVKAYYEKEAQDTDKVSKTNKADRTDKKNHSNVKTDLFTSTEQKQMAETKTKADALKSSANALMERGTDSVFKKIDVKDETAGITTKQYNTDKIYQAVKKFTDNYNSLVTQTAKTNNTSILRKGVTMIRDMAVYEDALNDIGVTINADNTLSIDEEAFKKADMTDVKSLFNGSVSAAAKVYQKASDIYNLASKAASSNALYNSNASYINSITGALYNNYL